MDDRLENVGDGAGPSAQTRLPTLGDSIADKQPDSSAPCPKVMELSADHEVHTATEHPRHQRSSEIPATLETSIERLPGTELHQQDDGIEVVGRIDQLKGSDEDEDENEDIPGSTARNDVPRIPGSPEAKIELPAPPDGASAPDPADRPVEEIGSASLLDERPALRKRHLAATPTGKPSLRAPPAGEEDVGGITLNKCLLVALLLVGVGFGIFEPDVVEHEGDLLDPIEPERELHSHSEIPHSPQTGSPDRMDPNPIAWIPIRELLEKLTHQKQQIHLIHMDLQEQKRLLEESLKAGGEGLPVDSQWSLNQLLQDLARYLSLEEEILVDLESELSRRSSAASRGQEALVAEALMLRRELDKQRGIVASMRQALEGLIERVGGLGEGLEVLAGLGELEQKLAFELRRSEVWEKVYGAGSWHEAPGEAQPDLPPSNPVEELGKESNAEAKAEDKAPGSTMSRPQAESKDEEKAPGSTMSRPQAGSQDEKEAPSSTMSRPQAGSQDEDKALGSITSGPQAGSQDEEADPGPAMSRPQAGSQDEKEASSSTVSRPHAGNQDEKRAPGSTKSRPQAGSKAEEKARVSGPQADGRQGWREEVSGGERPESGDGYRQRPGKEGRPDERRRPKEAEKPGEKRQREREEDRHQRRRERDRFWRVESSKRRADCSDLVSCARKDGAERFGVELQPVGAERFRELLREYAEAWKLGEAWSAELQDVVSPFFRDGLFVHDLLRFPTFVDRLEDYVEGIAERVFGDDDAVGDFEDHVFGGLFGQEAVNYKRGKKAERKSHRNDRGARKSAKQHGRQDGRQGWEKKWRPVKGQEREEKRRHMGPEAHGARAPGRTFSA